MPRTEAGKRWMQTPAAQVVTRRCRWNGSNRGWCVVHDAEWRIDRARCEPPIVNPEATDGS